MLRVPPRPPLFPYTTLFRSEGAPRRGRRDGQAEEERESRRRVGVGSSRAPSPPASCRLPPAFSHSFSRSSGDRKSTRLNSSHLGISYAVFCLKKKNASIYWM